MVGILPLAVFAAAMALLVFVLCRVSVHPFIAVLGVSLVFGIAAGIPIAGLPQVIGAGFSVIFGGPGLVVIFGILIAGILETSGATMKIADMIVRLVGRGSPTLAFMLMGWVVSLSLSAESGFVVLNPARQASVRHSGTGSIAGAAGLSGGAYVAAALFPLAPGPLAAAAVMGLSGSIPLLMLLATVFSLPALAAAYFIAVTAGRRRRTKEDVSLARRRTARSYSRVVGRQKLPGGIPSVLPVLVPVLLMLLGSLAGITGVGGAPGSGALGSGALGSAAAFLGVPTMAMVVGLLFALVLLAGTGNMKEFNPITESTLRTAGPVLCIMGAGGVLGRVIEESGLVALAVSSAGNLPAQALLLPFLIAAAVKTAQGSTAVAVLAAAGAVAPLVPAFPPLTAALALMAAGAGSMLVSHANDPYFWVVTRLSDIKPRHGYLSQTAMSAAAGLSCMAGILLFSLFAG